VMANAGLRERELIKLATLSEALAQALRERGLGEPDASLLAEAGMAVFRISFAQWVDESELRGWPDIVEASFARLRAVTGGA